MLPGLLIQNGGMVPLCISDKVGHQAMPNLKINKSIRKHILITAIVIFAVGSAFPVISVGCLHHSNIELGFPIPWFSVEVKYGKPAKGTDPYLHGPIDKIEGIQIHWLALPVAIAGSFLLGATLVAAVRTTRFLRK